MAYYSPQEIANYIKTNNLDAAGVANAAKQYGVSTGDLQLALPTIQRTGLYADQNHDSVGTWGNSVGLGNAVDAWVGATPLGGQTANGYDFSGWNANDTNDYAGLARAQQVAPGTTTDDSTDSVTSMYDIMSAFPAMRLDEQGRYQNAAINDPRYQWAVKNAANTSDKFDDIIAGNYEPLGRLNDRAFREDSDPDAFKDSALGAYWAGQLGAVGNKDLNLAPSQQASGENWNNYMSAEAQARRDPGDDVSPLALLAMAAALYFTGGAAAGAASGTAAGTGAGLSAGAGLAGTGAGLGAMGGLGTGLTVGTGLGAGVGAGLTAGAGLAGTGLTAAGLGSGLAAGAGLAGAMEGSTALGSLGGAFGQGGIYGTGLDTGSSLANTLAEKTISNTVMNGGDVGKGLTNSVIGLGTGIGTNAVLGALPSEVSTGLNYANTANKVAGAARLADSVLNPAEPSTRTRDTSIIQNGVNSMYSTALGRAPTQEETLKWTNMANQGFSPQDIVNEFKKSPEFLARRPT